MVSVLTAVDLDLHGPRRSKHGNRHRTAEGQSQHRASYSWQVYLHAPEKYQNLYISRRASVTVLNLALFFMTDINTQIYVKSFIFRDGPQSAETTKRPYNAHRVWKPGKWTLEATLGTILFQLKLRKLLQQSGCLLSLAWFHKRSWWQILQLLKVSLVQLHFSTVLQCSHVFTQ